jgi:hypothetical protein
MKHQNCNGPADTYIRESVTRALFPCRLINLASASCSFAFQISRMTWVWIRGPFNDSSKKARTSDAGTSGGSSLRTSTGSMRGLCRDIKSIAGMRRALSIVGGAPGGDEDDGGVGRRYMRRRVRNTPVGSGDELYTDLQYLCEGFG